MVNKMSANRKLLKQIALEDVSFSESWNLDWFEAPKSNFKNGSKIGINGESWKPSPYNGSDFYCSIEKCKRKLAASP